MGSFINLTGRIFGRLKVIRPVPERSSGAISWLCQCNCGKQKAIKGQSLTRGLTKSCGCLSAELTAKRAKAGALHGLSGTPIHNTWNCMVGRCTNPKIPPYKKYGARGIIACEYLLASPINLMSIIGDRPPGKTLDRINGKGSYTCGQCSECKKKKFPLNIQWSTPKEQARHTPRNVFYTIDGVTKCMEDWAQESNLAASTISHRFKTGLRGRDLIKPATRNSRADRSARLAP